MNAITFASVAVIFKSLSYIYIYIYMWREENPFLNSYAVDPLFVETDNRQGSQIKPSRRGSTANDQVLLSN